MTTGALQHHRGDMTSPPKYDLLSEQQGGATLKFSGDWVRGQHPPAFGELQPQLAGALSTRLIADGSALGEWDSMLMAFLLQCHIYCQTQEIAFELRDMPSGIEQLLTVATAVRSHEPPEEAAGSWLASLDPRHLLHEGLEKLRESLAFTGEVTIALLRLVRGKANTRLVDFLTFCHEAGPDAFPIISLTSVLVGMILAYLGAVQLQQFGAEVYVANLVVIGTLREMGVLMTAVVMAGRTGAAYAAQLGTMQTNEEIDAITTMGISPVEFLVLPRMLALVVIMPLLTIYADLLGIVGGGIVAGGMGISPAQYVIQGQSALSFAHVAVGLLKALVFASLIAIAGCRAGINSGRSSAAVGQAATNAVVTAVVYLIVADAAINIMFQQLHI
jgi:phospholipid/cholesterol/gamma-HCH transport system permease protein